MYIYILNFNMRNMHFVLAPHHSRAQNNRKYYEKILKEQANEDGDIQKDDDNVRDYRHSEEFMTYEKLCRGEETKVCITVTHFHIFTS